MLGPVTCKWMSLAQKSELRNRILALLNLITALVAQCLHDHGAIGWQRGGCEAKCRCIETHPNSLARSKTENRAGVRPHVLLQMILPTIPRGQIDLKAACPQLRHDFEQRHVEVAAQKPGAEGDQVCRQDIPEPLVRLRSRS